METTITYGEHPDLVLLANEGRRGIRCLVIRDAGIRETDALLLPGVFCVYRQGAYTALLYAQEPRFSLAELEAALGALGLCAGLSGPFELPASARGCMVKARIALETGLRTRPGRTLHPMDELVEAALLEAVRGSLRTQGFSPADFCDPVLWQMAATDEQRDTRYVESLYAYLSCGMDMKRAAQYLGVHRNTLAYRMERVQSLFTLDLKDESRCFELLFSLWLWHSLPHERENMSGAFDAQAAQAALWAHVEQQAPGEAGGDFACSLLAVGVGHMPDDERTALFGRLRACAPEDSAFAYDEDVLLAAVSPQALPAFEEQARACCAGCGCALVIAELFPAGRLYYQARIARMALCAAAGGTARTREICATLLFMAVERTTPLAPYLCEDVIRVMDDDAQKGTALSRSLYAYLLHFMDMKRAAGQIGMHRNTMEYHIRKIDALIGSGMDASRRFMMMCTYKMLALPDITRFGV